MDKEEFKNRVLPLSEKLFRFSVRLLGDSELSKDCVQESLIKLWENRFRLSQIINLQAFAFTIIKNIAIDKLRQMKRIDKNVEIAANQVIEPVFEMNESSKIIEKFIQKLPPQQKLILELRDIEGFSYDEIADATNLEVNNIRVNLSIARKKIKEELTKIYNYGLADKNIAGKIL